MTTKRKDGIEPTRTQAARILGFHPDGRLTLDELFVVGRDPDRQRLDHLKSVARLKVIGVFRVASTYRTGARRERPGHPVYTDHFLPGMNGDSDQLVRYILTRMKGTSQFVRVNDLPEQYRRLTKHWRESVRAEARYLLVKAVVDELIADETQLWYHAGHERWQASQSLIDEYEPLEREVRHLPEPKHRKKRDRRRWHGRPARDRKNGTVPGVSVGGCYH
jgi:hypothetical protein